MLDKLNNFLAPKLKVLAGDIPQGSYRLEGAFLMQGENVEMDLINNPVTLLKRHTEESAKDWLVSGGLAAGVTLATGPLLGLLALMFTGNNKKLCIEVHLKNGEQFLATMDVPMYNRLLSLNLQTKEE